MATHYGRIGPYGRALSHMGAGVLVAPHHGAARIGHIGEHAGRPQKHIVSAGHPRVQADVVLDLAIFAEDNLRADHHVLADVASLAQYRAGHDVAEVPNLGARPDGAALVQDSRFMGKPKGIVARPTHLL